MSIKICPKCGQQKTIVDFGSRVRRLADGRSVERPRGYCKACESDTYRNRPADYRRGVFKRWEEKRFGTVAARRKEQRAARSIQEAGGDLTRSQMTAIKALAVTCHYCRQPLSDDRTIDHVIPLVTGGRHTRENVVVSCRSCNVSKGQAAAPRHRLVQSI